MRDNEGTIRPCLESLKPWVDELVVVDTGSTDRTPEICEELGARVFYWAWRDDFAAARNESLSHARGEWIFWMDSDDTLPQECGRKLRALADGPHGENVLGYVVQVHCPGKDPADVTVVDHVKLIRNRPDLRFEFRIHEQILPAIRRAAGEVAWTDIHVVHSGSDHSPQGRQRKLQRDFHLLELELNDRPDHPFVLFNLGMTHADAGAHETAVQHLTRCLEVSQPDESHLRKAYALLIGSLAAAGRGDAAWERCREGLARFPDDQELLFRSAMLHHHFGRLEEAKETYESLLKTTGGMHFKSIDAGICGFKARHNLAAVYEELEDIERAEALWRDITETAPEFAPAWRGLGTLLLANDRHDELTALIRCAEQSGHETVAAILLSRQLEQHGEPALALQKLRATDRHDPRNPEILNELCRLLFYHGPADEAAESLRQLIQLEPQDACGWHNLGVVELRRGRILEAAAALRKSLELRPSSFQTREQLDYVEKQLRSKSQTAGFEDDRAWTKPVSRTNTKSRRGEGAVARLV